MSEGEPNALTKLKPFMIKYFGILTSSGPVPLKPRPKEDIIRTVDAKKTGITKV